MRHTRRALGNASIDVVENLLSTWPEVVQGNRVTGGGEQAVDPQSILGGAHFDFIPESVVHSTPV